MECPGRGQGCGVGHGADDMASGRDGVNGTVPRGQAKTPQPGRDPISGQGAGGGETPRLFGLIALPGPLRPTREYSVITPRRRRLRLARFGRFKLKLIAYGVAAAGINPIDLGFLHGDHAVQ
jgi:hypothetical protein